MSSNPKPRLRYFDMLKGVAIFMVVMGHVIAFCIRGIDRAPIFKFIAEIHMPLFFFVSGWFTLKLAESLKPKMPALIPRAIQLLLPMVVVSTIWIFYFPHSGLESPLDSTFRGLWLSVSKNGYWFTLVLFELTLVYMAILPLLGIFRSAWGWLGVMAATVVVLCAINNYLPADIAGYTSFEMVASFSIPYFFGIISRRFKDSFFAVIANTWVQTLSMLIFAVALYLCAWPWEFGLEGNLLVVLRGILQVALVIFVLPVFRKWDSHAFGTEASVAARNIARIWEYLGTQSLAIYLLHYFFLFPLGSVVRPWLESVNVAFVPLIVVAAFWSAIIVACVLGIVKLLEPSRQLSLLLTGKK